MTTVPQITVQGPHRKSWRPRISNPASFADVRRYVGRRALARIYSRKLWGVFSIDDAEFVIELSLVAFLHSAACTFEAKPDGGPLSGSGFHLMTRLTSGKLPTFDSRIAPLAGAVFAESFAWLRVQFPIASPRETGPAAAELIRELLARGGR